MLSKLLRRWSNKSTYDHNTRNSFERYINKFIIFLSERHTLSPTVDDMKTYFQNILIYLPPNIIDDNKATIASFLKVIEGMGIPQDHNVYDFLSSNKL